MEKHTKNLLSVLKLVWHNYNILYVNFQIEIFTDISNIQQLKTMAVFDCFFIGNVFNLADTQSFIPNRICDFQSVVVFLLNIVKLVFNSKVSWIVMEKTWNLSFPPTEQITVEWYLAFLVAGDARGQNKVLIQLYSKAVK